MVVVKLLMGFVKLHKLVSSDTFAGWINFMLGMAGIVTSKFTAGSIWPTTDSNTQVMSVPVNCIMAYLG